MSVVRVCCPAMVCAVIVCVLVLLFRLCLMWVLGVACRVSRLPLAVVPAAGCHCSRSVDVVVGGVFDLH